MRVVNVPEQFHPLAQGFGADEFMDGFAAVAIASGKNQLVFAAEAS